jgi:PAS domain S-box-containing protein
MMKQKVKPVNPLLLRWFPTRGMAFKIALVYTLLGGLWILVSGWLLHYAVKNADILPVLENVKGWFFILVTALLLGMALNRYFMEIRYSAQLLEESEARLRQAAAAGNVGLWDWDLQTNQMYYTPEWKLQIGYEAHEISDDYYEWENRLHPEDRASTIQKLRSFISNPSSKLEFEYRLQHKDGSYRWILSKASIITDGNGRPLRMLGAHIDVTDRRNLEDARANAESRMRQAQKMEALGALAGGIAHDFNNILSAIIGYSEIALAGTNDSMQMKNDLREVLKSAARARDLVRQILAFSRGGEQSTIPVQVGLIVKEALMLIRASLPSTIEIKQDVVSKAAVLADPTQIHQVMMNLCTNAAYAMRANGGILQVSLKDVSFGPQSILPSPDLKRSAYVKLSIEDNGHGIDPLIMDRIFDPFFTTKEQGVGTGLGLSVVHGIVKNSGGVVVAESVPETGTVFDVYLPVIEFFDDPPASEQTTPLPGGRERILVVDDEPALASTVSRLLQKLGYRAEFRLSGAEALETIRNQVDDNPFDLVITDMTMPQLTGADLARQLLDFKPDLAILIYTGYSEKIDSEIAKSLGIRGLLMKPIVLKELAAAVRKALDERSALK